MRLIAQFENDSSAKKFFAFLQKKGVESTLESQVNPQNDTFSYQIWVHDEDAIDQAMNYFTEFQKNPNDPQYEIPVPIAESTMEKNITPPPEQNLEEKQSPEDVQQSFLPYPYKLTIFFFAICAIVYLVNFMQELQLKKAEDKSYLVMTPIQYYLLFDTPHLMQQYAQIIKKYNYDPQKPLKDQSEALQKKWEEVENLPLWKGLYDLFLKKIKKEKTPPIQGKLFEKIRQGQVWRLFTPCILHTSLLHILFNMIWLWVLGKQVEERLSKSKYLLLTIIVGIISNIAQYMMSGPYFLGYSGIIMGLVGFIWSRQKVAPWEGYPLQKAIFIFLAFYVLAMVTFQIFSLFVTIFSQSVLNPPIANTAHIVGFLVGWFLGRFSWFSMEGTK